MSRRAQLKQAAPVIDVANPPEGRRLWLGVVASRLNVSITQMATVAEISRTAIADVLSNVWPKRTPQEQIRSALHQLLAERGATPDELGRLFHAYSRTNLAEPSASPTEAPQGATTTEDPTEQEEPDMLPLKAILTPQARRHFKLFTNPFDDVSSEEQMFSGAEFEYVREAAWQAAQTSGFVAIVGESGAGKTTVLEDLEHRLEGGGHRVIVFKPSVVGMEENDVKGKTLKSADLLYAIVAQLAPDTPMPQTMSARTALAKKLLTSSAGMGNTHLLVVEEAHCMPDATMKHLKRLHELRVGRRNLLGILLLAQPELKGRLVRGMLDGSLREVAQRCEVVELLPLDSDLKAYLQTRTAAVKVDLSKLIDDKGIEQLRNRLTTKAGGKTISLAYPLAVNNLMVRAMNAAAEIGAPVVSGDMVRAA